MYLSLSIVKALYKIVFFFFFFSSRRRHTRFKCDWSSDVCSSDLPKLQPTTFRSTPNEKAKQQRALLYGRCVGGTSVHFTANFWRFHEIDFIERAKNGPVAGTGLMDWPITYADLEPYYTKVEWEIGVSGLARASPFHPPRSQPYPMPPFPVKSSGVIFERGARKLGWHPFPAPMAINSQAVA